MVSFTYFKLAVKLLMKRFETIPLLSVVLFFNRSTSRNLHHINTPSPLPEANFHAFAHTYCTTMPFFNFSPQPNLTQVFLYVRVLGNKNSFPLNRKAPSTTQPSTVGTTTLRGNELRTILISAIVVAGKYTQFKLHWCKKRYNNRAGLSMVMTIMGPTSVMTAGKWREICQVRRLHLTWGCNFSHHVLFGVW